MRFFKVLGILTQALVLGSLLFAALVRMYGIEIGARVFRYAGF